MKTNRTRSMRDIPTIQGLRSRSTPGNRDQCMTELARLEHERTRLERELKLWAANQKRTEIWLQKVQERILLLQESLDLAPSDHRRSSADGGVEDGGGRKAATWREIPLEY